MTAEVTFPKGDQAPVSWAGPGRAQVAVMKPAVSAGRRGGFWDAGVRAPGRGKPALGAGDVSLVGVANAGGRRADTVR